MDETLTFMAETPPAEEPQPEPVDPTLVEQATQAQAQDTQQLFTDAAAGWTMRKEARNEKILF